jgi:hypothetical protein
MGTRQVLRVAAALVVAAALAAPADAGNAAGEPVIVIDLRPGDADGLRGSRAELLTELAKISGIAAKSDGGLDGALAGEASDTDAVAVRDALDEARTGFADLDCQKAGDLDCKKAGAAAERAIDLLAGRQAAGLDDGTALRGAWAYVLLCADRDGDRGRARTAADRLRALGVSAGEDAGISESTWARFPEIDASTDRGIVSLSVTTEPAGARVWIDHEEVGVSPVTVYVDAGPHLIAAADGFKRAAMHATAGGKDLAVTLPLVDRTGAYSAVAGVVKGWRDGALTPTAEALGTVMQSLEVRFALLLVGKGTMQVWAMGPRDEKPRRVDDVSREDPMAAAALITDRVAAWDGNAPDPDLELLVESDEERGRRGKGTPNRWWVYAAIVGAVALGTGILYFQDSADDHQRIEIRF